MTKLKLKSSEYYFSTPFLIPGDEDPILNVLVVEKHAFDNIGSWYDGNSPREILPEGFAESQDGLYEARSDFTRQDIEKKLTEDGFVYNPRLDEGAREAFNIPNSYFREIYEQEGRDVK